ncbi:MAG TPA: FAD-dependent monooxygenase [Gemmatimonadaceae bacterium]|nr:FAD-dependent monooxygenase [Gemmatimonadaceae bacterium]
MAEHAVVVAGAGPTGLMLAGELALAGVDVALVERRPNQELEGRRAGGLLTRSIEILDQRGIADRFISQGHQHAVSMFTGARFVTDLPTRHNYVLGLTQKHIERILAEWVVELQVPIHYNLEVTGFTQDERGVDIQLSDGTRMHAQYLVGCDGGRSVVRKTTGIEFSGWDATTSWLMAEAEMAQEPKWGFHEDARGKHAIGKAEGGFAGVVLIEPQVGREGQPTLDDIREALVAVYGTDYGIHNPRFISRFTDMTRQAAAYRAGRVFVAGDAAHVHSPVGGQGLNMGVQDAMNLGWKLAQVIKQTAPETLLDSYHAERHPVAARVLRTNRAQVLLARTDDHTRALRDTLNEIFGLDEPSRYLNAMMAGLDIHYDLGAGHPLLGRRMPDQDLATAGGPMRVYTLLHAGRPVLINFGEPGAIGITPWRDRVQVVDARYAGAWTLPSLGVVDAPAAVLVRPDGYVAWVGDSSQAGLVEALTTWFGPPAAP